jgi:ribonucleotide reductase beta subunit family protein with ferritin-like domain
MTWFAHEVNINADRHEFKKLAPETQHFIKMILGFFAISDAIVADNIGINFGKEVTIREAKVCYNFQARMEDVHNETYSLLLTEYIEDEKERAKLLNSIEHHESIRGKAEWAQRYMQPGETEEERAASFPRRLLAFACVEGIFFSGSFCAIYWLADRGYKLKGLIDSNKWIARDEGQHTLFACHLYSMVRNRLSEAEAQQIVADAVELETAFINDALRCELIGMNATLMTTYIQYIADHLLELLGYSPIYNVPRNPFEFLKKLELRDLTSFFETETTEYQKPRISLESVDLHGNDELDDF